jgi:uncharacterized protein
VIRARFLVLVATLTSVACSGPGNVTRCTTSRTVAQPPPRVSPIESVESLGDAWVGGFGPNADLDAGAFLRVDFSAGLTRLHPSEDRAPLGIIHPKLQNEPSGRLAVRFAIDDGKRKRAFQLHRTSIDVLDGTVTDEKGSSAHAHLLRLVSYDRKGIDDAFAGTYAVNGDPHRLLLVGEGSLFDTRDGSERRLFLRSGNRALVGAGVATAYPSPGDITIDGAGALRLEGDTPLVAHRFGIKSEEVRFASTGVTLQGTLLSPPSAGPHPVVVNVHGSGRVTRKDHWANAMARVFLAQGYAVFLYDKRGVGDSGGEYVGRGGRDTNNVSRENLERLASDAVAAAAALAARSDIDATRVGLIGLSQAGWIIPLAAKKSKAIRFFILMSGPSVHTTVELAFSALVGNGDSCMSIEEADRVAHDHAPRTGFDPAPMIAALEVPGLWVYGALDASIPVPASMRVLEALRKKHDFDVTLIPEAGHELYRVRRDIEEERQLSTGISPVALDAVRSWLTRHVDRTP